MRECEIFYVKQPGNSGWKWRPVGQAGTSPACDATYALFYECVTAARAKGFTPVPALKCA